MLCSCKRKCGGAQAVLEDVRSLLHSLPAPVLSASLCSSAVVHEWARANVVLKEGQQESLCHVLQNVSVGETLRWLWAELKEYQSLDRCVCVCACVRACVCVCVHATSLPQGVCMQMKLLTHLAAHSIVPHLSCAVSLSS